MTIHTVALSNSDGVVEMRFDPNNTGIGTVEKLNTLENNDGIGEIVNIDVQVRRLDSYEFKDVAFIKIDVEGHEPSVILGGIETIKRCRPYILMECEVRHNPKAYHHVVSSLYPLGYSVYYVDSEKLVRLIDGGIEKLQACPVNSHQYVNNFLLLPDEKLEILPVLTEVLTKRAKSLRSRSASS